MHANFIGRFVMIDGEAFRTKCDPRNQTQDLIYGKC